MPHVKDFQIGVWDKSHGWLRQDTEALLGFDRAPATIRYFLELLKRSSSGFDDMMIGIRRPPVAHVVWQPNDYRSAVATVSAQECECQMFFRGWKLVTELDPLDKPMGKLGTQLDYAPHLIGAARRAVAAIPGPIVVTVRLPGADWTNNATSTMDRVAASLASAYFTLLVGLFANPVMPVASPNRAMAG